MLRVIKTENGFVRGIPAADPRITAFKGIPFAAPPVGDLRWKAPQPAANWEGVRDCFTFAPISMQNTPGLDPNSLYAKEWHVDPEIPMSEDSLYLNVWTPTKTGDEKLPVMIWIFGGGLQEGYPAEMEFDGERIARRGVVLVSINYRLNVFGFFTHPDLVKEAGEDGFFANWGLQDQRAAFMWVQRNIAAFGGDPNNVTIFGQSAGGGSVHSQMCSPTTKGLFHKAILQSAGGMSTQFGSVFEVSLEQALESGEKFLASLGVKTVEEARKIDAKTLFAAVRSHRGFFHSFVDGRYMVESNADIILKNKHHDITYMLGNTSDEMRSPIKAESKEALLAFLIGRLGEEAGSEVYRLIEIKADGDFTRMLRFAEINNFALGAQSFCRVQNALRPDKPAFYYYFDAEIPGDNAGVFHSVDLWFQFETLAKCWRPFKGKHYDLARQMCNYWTNFAKNGNPNGLDADGTPMPEWKPYTKDSRYGMYFGDVPQMQSGAPDPVIDYLVTSNCKKLGITD